MFETEQPWETRGAVGRPAHAGNRGHVVAWVGLVSRAGEGAWHRECAGVRTDAASERPCASASVSLLGWAPLLGQYLKKRE